jgi:MinD superfamily P-loop ATPase
MIIAIASGKGGTGKTTIATSLAIVAGANSRLLDCDVEEPNAHLFIKPKVISRKSVSIPVPEVDPDKCNYCGKCAEVCAYNAIAVVPSKKGGKVLIFPELCHGCGACTYLCPQGALRERDKEIGVIEDGTKNGLKFTYGRLNIGEAMAPPLIRAVKEYIDPSGITLIDAPPGTSCPVITAVSGADFCILVTEPTPFGLNDLTLAVEVLRKMEIKFGVVINRADVGDTKTDDYCAENNIPILMRVPFSRKIAEAYSRGVTVVEALPELKGEFIALIEGIKK